MRYKTMPELIELIDRPAKIKIFDIYHQYKQEFTNSRGSEHNHQEWVGGYIDHVVEVMNIARLLYQVMNDKRKMPFSLSDALIVLFLHDLEKAFPNRIRLLCDTGYKRPKAKSKVKYQLLHEEKVWEYLTNEHKNAIDFIEGENEHYTNQHKVMRPLAAFVHMCDVASARLWYDRPHTDYETWGDRESQTLEDECLWGV